MSERFSAALSKEASVGRGDSIVTLKLPSGARVALDRVPGRAGVSFGTFVAVGSQDDPRGKGGLHHFLEHLAFKGTEARSASEIAVAIDRLGGEFDASVSREMTIFSDYVAAHRLDDLIELTFDMIYGSIYPPEEIERERSVIIEEIKMGEDDPIELIENHIFKLLWPNTQFGEPIYGSIEGARSLRRADFISEIENGCYAPDRMIISAAGAIDIDRTIARIEKSMNRRSTERLARVEDACPIESAPESSLLASARSKARGMVDAIWNRGDDRHMIFDQNRSRLYLSLAAPGVTALDDDFPSLSALEIIFGGGASSRLFSQIREKLGLVYSISSEIDSSARAGLIAAHLATEPSSGARALDEVLIELEKFSRSGPTRAEFELAKKMELEALALSHDSLSARMSAMARGIHFFGAVRSIAARIEEIVALDYERTCALARRFFRPENFQIIALGPIDSKMRRAIKRFPRP